MAFCVLGLVGARPALAATCTGTTVTGTGNVTVPAGATCTLTGGTINGNINVEPGGSLSLNGVIVKGTVTALDPTDFDIRNSYVGGISVRGTTGAGEMFQICNNKIAGDASFRDINAFLVFGDLGTSSPAACGSAQGNQVCGSISFTNFTGRVQGNTVNGSGSLTNGNVVQFDGNKFRGTIATTGTTFDSNTGNQATTTSARAVCTATLPVPPPATLTCGPSSVDFGNVTVGQFAEQSVNCTASGNDVTIGSVSITPTPPFTLTSDGCSGVTLQPAESCGMLLRFTPTTTGPANGSLSVPHNASNTSPIVTPLTGNGQPVII
jgi:hypothetical protein